MTGRRRTEVVQVSPPPPPPAPIVPLPDPDGAAVTERIRKARELAATRTGRSALSLASTKRTGAPATIRPKALGGGN